MHGTARRRLPPWSLGLGDVRYASGIFSTIRPAPEPEVKDINLRRFHTERLESDLLVAEAKIACPRSVVSDDPC